MLLSTPGADPSPGTKLISLSGRVQRPGLVEVPNGDHQCETSCTRSGVGRRMATR